MTSLRTLWVVIASPDDVAEERAALPSVIQRLNSNTGERLGITLRVKRWEDVRPGFDRDGTQDRIDSFLKIEDSDIFIGILWKKFGTPGRDGRTGTEHEFYKAYEAWDKNNRPEIMLYFKQQEYFFKTRGESEQLTAVLKFKEKIQNEAEGIYSLYSTIEQFKEKVYDHLSDYIAERFKDRKASPVQQTATSDKLLLKEIEKRSLPDKRQVIYDDLVKNIFGPLLRYKLETAYDYPISRLKLYYDLSSLKENPNYDEAKLHWEQDLKDIGIDPELIERQVNALNKDVDIFFTSQIREPVIAAITKDRIFTAFESGTDIPPLNQISILNVIKQLQSDWIEDTGVDKVYHKDTREYVLGDTIITIIEPQDETRLENIINSLTSKNNSISHHIQEFKKRRGAIWNDVMKLNSEINKRIVNRISKRLYRTTCRMCNDNVLAGG